MNADDTLNLGLLLLRLGFAALLFGHATQKLFAWFRGNGPRGTGAVFEQWGFVPGPRMAVVAGLSELLGLSSIALGLLTPGGSALLIGTMLVAAAPSAPNGLWAHMGGNEVPVFYAGLAAVIAFTGPGRFSLDHAFGLDGLHAIGWAVGAVAVGVVASVPVLLRRRATLHAAPTAASPASTSAGTSNHNEVTHES